MAERARKTIQLATAFLGDQLVASLLANQTNQVEYTLQTEFQLPTKSKSVLSDDLAVAVGGGGGSDVGGGGSTVIVQLTQPSFPGFQTELGNISAFTIAYFLKARKMVAAIYCPTNTK